MGLIGFGFLIPKVRQALIGTAVVMGVSSAALCLIPTFSAGMKIAFFFFAPRPGNRSAAEILFACSGLFFRHVPDHRVVQ
jgi:hypothetical protein